MTTDFPFPRPGWAIGDALDLARRIPDNSIDCIVTSPPYWGLRSYLSDDDPDKALEMGAEPTLGEYVERLIALFSELRRALKPEGVCWLNLGDSYANDGKWGGSSGGKHTKALHGSTGVGRGKVVSGLKPKDLCLVPYRVAIALQADGWWVRDNIVWHKPNPMPSSVKDRCTPAHEAVFLLTKSGRYWFDAGAIAEKAVGEDRGPTSATDRTRNSGGRSDGYTTPSRSGGHGAPGGKRNARNVWRIPTKPYTGSHYAVMPPELARRCIVAGCPKGGLVLDPFGGSGTVGMVAAAEGRDWLLFDLDERNAELMRQRTPARSLDDALSREEPGALDGQQSLFGGAS